MNEYQNWQGDYDKDWDISCEEFYDSFGEDEDLAEWEEEALEEGGEDDWLDSYWESQLEMGFDPYEGCWTGDC